MQQLKQRGRQLGVEPGALIARPAPPRSIPNALRHLVFLAVLVPVPVPVAVPSRRQTESPRRALIDLLDAVGRHLDHRLGGRVGELKPPRDFFAPSAAVGFVCGFGGFVGGAVPRDVGPAPRVELRDAPRTDRFVEHVHGAQRAVERALSSPPL